MILSNSLSSTSSITQYHGKAGAKFILGKLQIFLDFKLENLEKSQRF